jgi:hypothetical protein
MAVTCTRTEARVGTATVTITVPLLARRRRRRRHRRLLEEELHLFCRRRHIRRRRRRRRRREKKHFLLPQPLPPLTTRCQHCLIVSETPTCYLV